MSHADAVREKERDVVEAAKRWRDSAKLIVSDNLMDAVTNLRQAEAATCPTCNGTGENPDEEAILRDHNGDKCPAGCDNGRALGPEGEE